MGYMILCHGVNLPIMLQLRSKVVYLIGMLTHMNTERQAELCLQIKVELLRRGISQKSIADALKVTEGAVSLFMKGERRSKRFTSWVRKNLGIYI